MIQAPACESQAWSLNNYEDGIDSFGSFGERIGNSWQQEAHNLWPMHSDVLFLYYCLLISTHGLLKKVATILLQLNPFLLGRRLGPLKFNRIQCMGVEFTHTDGWYREPEYAWTSSRRSYFLFCRPTIKELHDWNLNQIVLPQNPKGILVSFELVYLSPHKMCTWSLGICIIGCGIASQGSTLCMTSQILCIRHTEHLPSFFSPLDEAILEHFGVTSRRNYAGLQSFMQGYSYQLLSLYASAFRTWISFYADSSFIFRNLFCFTIFLQISGTEANLLSNDHIWVGNNENSSCKFCKASRRSPMHILRIVPRRQAAPFWDHFSISQL